MMTLSLNTQRVLLIGASIIFMFAATYRLSESPAIWYDEGFYTQAAMNLADRGTQEIQLAPSAFVSTEYVTVGYPLIFPVSLSYKMFGVGVTQGRAVMVVFMTLFFIAAFFCIRGLFGASAGVWSALLLASFAMLYGNGKSVLGEVPGLFFLMLALCALVYCERTMFKDWRGYAWFGLAAGLCAATKPIFILFIIACALVFALRFKQLHLKLWATVLGVAAFLAPLALWASMQFAQTDSIASVLGAYANPYEITDWKITILHNALRFCTESTPIYFAVLMVLWAVALWMRRKIKLISSAELAAFFFCLLIIANFLRLEGWYRYLFPGIAVALLFLPSSLGTILKKYPLAPVILLSILFFGQLYQTAHSSYVADYYRSTGTQDLQTALASLGTSKTFFIYDVPEVAVLLPSWNYYQFLQPHPGLIYGEDELALLARGVPDIVIVSPSAYAAHANLFTRYAAPETVGGYDLLIKRPQ
jgi:4-amino-4-deoxy-L-arabinose transferase-like glycosyltransferase